MAALRVPPDPVLTERIYQPYLKLLTALAGGAGLQAGQVGGNPRVDAKAGPAQQLSPWQRWRARRKIERRARRGISSLLTEASGHGCLCSNMKVSFNSAREKLATVANPRAMSHGGNSHE